MHPFRSCESAMQQVCMVPYGLAKLSFVWFTIPKIERTLSGLEMSQHSEHRSKQTHLSLGKEKKKPHREQTHQPFVWYQIKGLSQRWGILIAVATRNQQACSVLLNKSCACTSDQFGMVRGWTAPQPMDQKPAWWKTLNTHQGNRNCSTTTLTSKFCCLVVGWTCNWPADLGHYNQNQKDAVLS